MEKKISYTFWGDEINTNWDEWYEYVKKMFNNMGYNITHYGFSSKSYSSNNIVTAKRKEKEIAKIIQSGEIPDSIECYSLPENFRTAVSDYNYLCVRTSNFISVVFTEKDLNRISEADIMKMKNYIKFSFGEVYSTYGQVPVMYAYTKDKRSVPSYELIKRLE